MSQAFKNNVLTKALEKWLVTMPRWGYTQADELNELLEKHRRLVPHTQLPHAVLCHPIQLKVLLREGFALDSVAVGVDMEGNVIRRLACLLDAPLETHELLTHQGVAELTSKEFFTEGTYWARSMLLQPFYYVAKVLPEEFGKVSSQQPALLAQVIVGLWTDGKTARQPQLIKMLVDNGVPKEFLLALPQAQRMKAEVKDSYEKLIHRLSQERLEAVLPAATGRSRPRL